jgi:hypothetical protein
MKNNVAGLGMVAKNGVSPPRWEAEIWRITVLTRPAQAKKKKKVGKTSSQSISLAWWHTSVIPAMQKA